MNTVLAFLKQLDKLLHILVSFSLTMTLGYLLLYLGLPRAVVVAANVTLVIAALKEWYDYKHPEMHTADWLDFLADVIGVAAAALVLMAPLIRNYF